MKRVFPKLIALALALVMVFALLVSCKDKGNDNKGNDSGKTLTDPYAGKTHAEVSEELYNKVLGEFYEYYDKATQAKTVSERYALMAIAEAKLLGAGIMLPSTANGGSYAISHVAPRTISSVLWGTDEYRFHNALVVDGDPLKIEDINALKAIWAETKGTGTYEAKAKEYLAAHGYKLKDTYGYGYTSDPVTWDWLNTYQAADFRALVNLYDGLLEYNSENVQVPALATSYTVSDDGLTYTFKLREGVNWVDYQGNVIEEVTANSFVKGLQHLLDAEGGVEYLVDGVIKGVSEYLSDEDADFSHVGIKAKDKYTLEYTLTAPCSYFITMLSYTVFAPISEQFFKANGGAFGRDEFKAAKADTDKYKYGTSFEKIAYCGPYLVTSATAENSIVFEANPAYWNKDNITIKKITWTFISGQDKTETYNRMKAGDLAGAALNANTLAIARENGDFAKYAYVSSLDASSFPVFFNLYRKQYGNFNDATVAPTTLSDVNKIRTNLAMQNKNFRLALVTSLDRAAENAVLTGDDLKYTSLVNSYTPGDYVSLTEEVTVKIGGVDKTFPAGTYYGAIVQAQLDADGIKIKVWDPTAEGGIGSSTGFDGWYNVDYARENLQKAIAELKAQGVEITKENPIILEMPYFDINEPYANRSNVLKQSIEASLEGYVKIELVKTGGSNARNWYNAGYYPTSGDLMNYNLTDVCGWGPDYGDPATYLDTMLPQGGGMAKNIGLF